MKVMIRRVASGYSAYVPKRDLEADVVEVERTDLWGGWIRLKNGWVLVLPELAPDTALPITVNARLVNGSE